MSYDRVKLKEFGGSLHLNLHWVGLFTPAGEIYLEKGDYIEE